MNSVHLKYPTSIYDCHIMKDMHRNTRAVLYEVFFMALNAGNFAKWQLYLHSTPNSLAKLRSYRHFAPNALNEYSGYYGPRKSSMKTFSAKVNKKTWWSPLPDGNGDSLSVYLKKILNLLRQGIREKTKSNIEEHGRKLYKLPAAELGIIE